MGIKYLILHTLYQILLWLGGEAELFKPDYFLGLVGAVFGGLPDLPFVHNPVVKPAFSDFQNYAAPPDFL